MVLELVEPTLQSLPGYQDALQRGWSPDNVSPERTALLHLAWIAEDPAGFVASLTDIEAMGAPIMLPDGSKRRASRAISSGLGRRFLRLVQLPLADRHVETARLLPRPYRLFDRELEAAPRLCDGRPAPLLDQARQRGLDQVELTTQPGNLPSQKVIWPTVES